jgi:two-component system chemotaxis sensor kinase CheA
MAHSIKSMAASLGYDSVTELAHKLEDRMQTIRAEGIVSSPAELDLLFRGLEGLEQMVVVVRDTGEAPPVPEGLLAQLSQRPDPFESEQAAAKKKLLI